MYTSTPEQKAKAKERRERIQDLTRRIARMSEAERAALVHGLATTIEGHTLSMTNQMLIAYQSVGQQQVTIVGGFQQWKRAGRTVTRGQHGYAIWVPIGRKSPNGQEKTETTDGDKPGFMLATVFDISQTQEVGQ